jgi:hypothetical protein
MSIHDTQPVRSASQVVTVPVETPVGAPLMRNASNRRNADQDHGGQKR